MLLSAIILWGTAALLALVVMRRPGRRFPEALPRPPRPASLAYRSQMKAHRAAT